MSGSSETYTLRQHARDQRMPLEVLLENRVAAILSQLLDNSMHTIMNSSTRQPDITGVLRGRHILTEVKVTSHGGLLPPSTLMDLLRKVDIQKSSVGTQTAVWMLVTNNDVSPSIQSQLYQAGIKVFTFSYDDEVRDLDQRLSDFVTSLI